jgi:chromosome segregation ATPase
MGPLVLAAAGAALVLLLVLFWRLAQRIAAQQEAVERLQVVQRDMNNDVRARLDEGARTWESVEHEMRPRIDQLEPSVADLAASLAEHLPVMGEARRRLERVEERAAEIDATQREGLEQHARETRERIERIEEAVRALRDAADGQLAELARRVDAREAMEVDVALPKEPSSEEAEPLADPAAAMEAAADAPATYGTPPEPEKPRRGWRFWRPRSQSTPS